MYYEIACVECEWFIRELVKALGLTYKGQKTQIYKTKLPSHREKSMQVLKPMFSTFIPYGEDLTAPTGYYVNIRPRYSFLGGGAYTRAEPGLAMLVRNAIAERPDEFVEILAQPAFAKAFTLDGKKLKSVPRRYCEEHGLAEYLKYRSWTVKHPVFDAQLCLTSQIVSYCAETLTLLQPLIAFLESALGGASWAA